MNIKIAYALTFFKNSWFWLGVWIFYYLRFTNYAGIGLIETSLIIAMTVSEIPTGAIADLFGKKKTLMISFLLQAIGIFMLAFALNVYWIIVGVFIAGIGGSFYSGTLDALVYDSLKDKNEEKKYDRVIANINSISLIAPAVCGVIGGWLYSIAPNIPFITSASAYLIGLLLCFFLYEPKIDSEKFSFANFIRQSQVGLKHLLNKNLFQQTILLLSIGVIIIICDEMLNSFLGVEFKFTPTQLSILWPVIYIVSSLVSQGTPIIKKYLSYNQAVIVIGFIIAASLIISPIVGMTLGGISLLLRSSMQALYNNASSIIINQNTESKYRATTLSSFNLLKNIPYVLTAYYLGSLADHYSARMLASSLGFILIILIVLQTINLFSSKSKRSGQMI